MTDKTLKPNLWAAIGTVLLAGCGQRGGEPPAPPPPEVVFATAEKGNLPLDLAYTGESYGSIFNGNVNRIKGYAQVNAQLQLNGPDEKWYVKGFIQNVFDSASVTGLYITDQSSGNYTNIFTLEPRRYGIAAGVKF